MRTAIIILSLIVVVLSWLLFDTYQTASDNTKALQDDVKFQKDSADMANKLVLVYKDSFILSEQARILDREEADRKHQATVAKASRNNKTKAQVAQVQPLIDSLAKKDTIVMTLNVAYLACDSLVTAQADELTAQGKLLIQTETSLNLSQNALTASQNEAEHLRASLAASEELSAEREKRAKKRGFRRGLVAGIGLGIIALII